MARDSFRDKVVIVTGASDGIGRELAVQLAAEGACLALASRNADRLNAVAAECVARGGRAVVIPTDVSDREACGRLVEKTVAAFGRIDMLISNAGISMWARFADVKDPEMIERILRVNFLGAMYCTWHALPYLRQSRGRIVAVSSISGWYPAPTGSGYAASKYALRGFFDSIREELRPDGVSVTVAYPGFVRTRIFERFLDARGKPGPDVSGLIPGWVMMPVDRCARGILSAARRRKREVVQTLFGKLLVWLNALAPRPMGWVMGRVLERKIKGQPPCA